MVVLSSSAEPTDSSVSWFRSCSVGYGVGHLLFWVRGGGHR